MTTKQQKILDAYPLSPLQEGMLFHALLAPESSAYSEQLSCELEGDVDAEAFQRAWREVVHRHTALRTAFDWQIRKEPLQIVFRQVEPPWKVEDWREVPPDEQEARLEGYLEGDRRKGFELSRPPLMRFALLRRSESAWTFVWTIHHILLDGWSTPLILKEVFSLYEAYRQGRSLPLEPAPRYKSYIQWLRKQDLSRAEDFWRRTLSGLEGATPLGVDRQDGDAGEETYGEVERYLSRSTTAGLEKLAQSRRLTLNTLVQGAWALLLSRYSGERDVVFGTTVSGRSCDLPGIESLVGPFINTLPVRARVSRGESLLSWLAALHGQQQEARLYEHAPLVAIHGWSGVPQDRPLFESLLVFENYPVDSALEAKLQGLAGFEVSGVRFTERTNYPLSLLGAPGERLFLKAVHDRRRLSTAASERLLGHLEVLLEGFVADPEAPAAGRAVMSAGERRQVLADWNATDRPVPGKSFPEIVSEHAAATPDSVALVFESARLTYGELERRSNRLARWLARRGVDAGVRVGLAVERSPEMIVGALGIMKAGGAYVPLDPTYPADRLAYMASDSGVPLVLTGRRVAESLSPVLAESAPGARLVDLDSVADELAAEGGGAPDVRVEADQLAYVIYTSGSTGKPKGVLVPHRGLGNVVAVQREAFGPGEGRRVLQFSSLSFDISVFEVLLALGSGGTLVLGRRDTLMPGPGLVRYLGEQAVSTVVLPPSVLGTLPEDELPQIDTVVVGGESCPAELVSRWAPGRRFANGYGPTETTIWTTLEKCRTDGRRPPIGRPIANLRTYVVSAALEPMPAGAAGELVAGGLGVVRGYHGRPGLTAERFAPDPFSGRAGSRLYRTGDLVRFLDDGRIEFLGRIDHQVKVRGFRIELGEIETALGRHPAVAETLVTDRDDARGQKRLVAYLVARDEVSAEELRRSLLADLPDYMVPSAFVFLDTMPLTASAKIDRDALPSPEEAARESEFVAPRTPTEELLAGVWREVLGVDRVGSTDEFFALGGHSLYATQVMSRLGKVFETDLPLRMIFEESTLAGLAARIDALRREGDSGVPPLVRREGSTPPPLSFSQQRLWFLDRFEPMKATYNIPMAVGLEGALRLSILRESLAAVVRRHESLRTTIATTEGGAVQRVGAPWVPELPVVDLSALDETRRRQVGERLLAEAAQEPFDLERGPLLRALLVRLDPRRHWLAIVMHHIISDGWSMAVFVREVGALYEASLAGRPSPLPEPELQFGDYADWQRRFLAGEARQSQLEWWREALAGAPSALELPADRPRPAVQTFRGADLPFELPEATISALRQLTQREGVTPFMALLAAFGAYLSRLSGQRDVVVGSPIANRNRPEAEGLIGFLVNTQALRVRLEGRPSFRQLLRQVRETTVAAYSRQDLPFEDLVSELAPERDLSRTPIFQVCFALRQEELAALRFSDLRLAPVRVENRASKFDLTLDLVDGGDRIGGRLEYSTDLFDRSTVARMARGFRGFVDRLLADPRRPVSEVETAAPAELHQTRLEWNDSAAAYPRESALHRLVEARADESPEAVAVTCGSALLTYGELDRRANRLARHLRELGAGLDDRVGLFMDRSPELLVSLYAILKTGAAYIPFDPHFPADRLRRMVRQSRAPWLVTSGEPSKRIPRFDGRVIDLERDAAVIARQSGARLGVEIPANAIAYALYTSGSTGIPKGVAVEHRSIVRLVRNSGFMDLGRDESFLQLAPVPFDVSTLEIWGPLANGGRLVSMKAGRPSLAEIAETVEAERVSSMWLTAGLFHLMVDEHPDALRGVRQVLAGGDVLSVDHVRRLLPTRPGHVVIDGYGPTENTTFSSCYRMTRPADLGSSVSIGRPIGNSTAHLLDASFEEVPIGVTGELFAGGDGVARGYLDDPRQTAGAFLPDPWSPRPGSRLYRTGDLARYMGDGNMEFFGRHDHQVKLRGFRIELPEIELALAGHPTVRECLVTVFGNGDGAVKRLAAYVVPAAGSSVSDSDLRSYLGEKLPAFMIPAVFVSLQAFPLGPTGKVDRRALPSPEAASEESYVAPKNDVEAALAEIWRDLLGVARVGVEDNFFALGGDSILSLQVVARASERGLRLTVKQLFEHQTISRLARVVTSGPRIAAEQGLVTGEAPITPVQHWFFEQDLAVPEHFNHALLLEMPGVTAGDLEGMLRFLGDHHDALRTRFHAGSRGWTQRFAAAGEAWSPLLVDLSGLPSDAQGPRVTREAARLQASLDLAAGPVALAAVFDLGAEAPLRLLLAIHHLVVDAVSWRLLLQDLETLRRQSQGGEPHALPPKSTSFKVWSERLAERARSEELAGELETWAGHEGFRPTPLPRDRASGSNTFATSDSWVARLDADETRAFLRASRSARIGADEILLTAVARALRTWSGGERFAIDLESHGRAELFEDVDLSRTVGWFTSIYPVRLDLSSCRSGAVSEDLKLVKETLRRVEDLGLGWGLLRYQSEHRDALEPMPPAEVSFNYLGQFDQEVAETAGGGESLSILRHDVGPAESPANARRHLLEIGGAVVGGRLEITLRFSGEVHRSATMEKVGRDLVGHLAAVVAASTEPGAGLLVPSDVPLARLGQAELDRLAAAFPALEDVYPLTPLQEGMLYHNRLDPGGSEYVVQIACRLHGSLDRGALERSWQRAVARHPVLRTAFVGWEWSDRPLQVVLSEASPDWHEKDWRDLDEDVKRRKLTAFLETDRRCGFDVGRAPLLRFALLRTEDAAYRMLVTFHHLLLDGWSLSLLLAEVFAGYRAEVGAERSPVGDVPPYRRYIAWLDEQDASRAERFWRDELAGFTEPTPLPFARELPGAGNGSEIESAEHGRRLSRRLTAELKDFAGRHRLTLNTLVQAAWGLLLSRATGNSDVVFGVTSSGRPADLSDVDSMLGLFINTLPLRLQVGGEPLLAWLQNLQARQIETRQYEYSPLVDVRKWSETSQGSPLFESLVVFESYPLDKALGELLTGLEVTDVEAVERSNYPLMLTVAPGEALGLRLSYHRHRFDATDVTRLLGFFESVLTAFVRSDRTPVSARQVELGQTRDEHQYLQEWNDTRRDYPETDLVELLETQARRTPAAPAVVFEGSSLSYRELHRRADRLAASLAGAGVGEDSLVGVFMERSAELVVALVAVLKAGAGYVPIDPSYPEDRRRFMLEDSGVKAVLTQERLRHHLAETGLEVFCADAPLEAAAAEGLATGRSVDRAAYMIYTSGSTGRPKGVVNSHRGIVNRLLWSQDRYAMTEADRVLHKTPFSFDVSVWELFWPLTVGAQLVVARPEGHKDGAYLVDLIERHGITLAHFVPSMLRVFVDQPEVGRCRSLRRVVASGEALPRELQQSFSRRLGCALSNLYGPTEAAIEVTRWDCDPRDEREVPIGYPIANTRIHLLDRRLRPVPVGAAGELHIAGVQVARGYAGRAALTAERFVPDPFVEEPSARLYKTGDLARYRSDGAVEYLGRLDHQVKIRGFRIETGEIEADLARHPEVAAAAVLARRSSSGDARLAAYVVAAGEVEHEPTAAARLSAHLRERLPDFMVPSAIVFLDALPVTANGKLDRRALPDPEHGVARGSRIAPRTLEEEVLAGLWREVLGIEAFGVEDSFFELGGHSLLAARLVSRVREAFDVELELAELFDASTIAAQAERIGVARSASSAPPLAPAPRDEDLPLSFAQRRVWFLDRLQRSLPSVRQDSGPAGALFNIPVLVRLKGRLDVGALESARAGVVRRHEALRTTFVEHRGEPRQRVAPDLAPALERVDLRALPAGERQAEAQRVAGQVARRPFALTSEAPWRACLIALGEEDHLLAMTVHHIVFDGASSEILLRELAAGYSAATGGPPADLPEPAVQYADYAAWQRGWLAGDVLASELDYWRERLAGAPDVIELPTDRPRPAARSFRGASHAFTVAPETARALADLGQSAGATTYLTVQAVMKTLLHRYTGQSDITVGSSIAHRPRRELEGLIGFFVNNLALRTELDRGMSFRRLLEQVRAETLADLGHQNLPFEELVDALKPRRDLSHTPIFQVMLAFQSVTRGAGAEIAGLAFEPQELPAVSAQFDLTLEMVATEAELFGRLEYDTDLFDPPTIERMAAHLGRLCESVTRDPGRSLASAEILGRAELGQMLDDWNDTAEPYRRDLCVHRRFEEWVEATPEAPALAFGADELTYAELDRRANRLARLLVDEGMAPEKRVGLCLEKGSDLLVGVLGILKAGAAFVPLDPAYPRERLAFMVDDARLAAMVTREGLLERLPETSVAVCFDRDAAALEDRPATAPTTTVTADNTAYVIYTSGSTGRPKGTLIRHRGVASLMRAQRRDFLLAPRHQVLQFASFSFDASIFDIVMAIEAGATLHMATADELLPGPALFDLLAERRITHITMPPSALDAVPPGELPDLENIVVAGEACPRELVEKWAPGRRFWNAYGPTESTIWATAARCHAGGGKPLIGRPIPNVRVYALDRDLGPVPAGVAGELAIAGEGLTTGYLRRPALSAAKLVPDPFSGEPGRRLYRTGDLVRHRAGGELDFLGRIDHQVKIRGFRIEPGEIERVLEKLPAVGQAVVQAVASAAGDPRLVAWVAPPQDGSAFDPAGLEPAALRDALQERLPAYMVPRSFVPLDAMPLSPNGKVDRGRLPRPEAGRRESFVAPRTATEEIMAGIWADLLQIEEVGAHDEFFELGGHSLLATRLASRVSEAFGVELPLRALFEGATLAELASRVETLRSLEAAGAPAIVPVSREGHPPLSFAQQRLWFLDQLDPGSTAYSLPMALSLEGPLEVGVLERTVTEIVRRHEILRTRLRSIDGEPAQVVLPAEPVPLPVTDLSGLPEDARHRQARRLAAADARRPFDLAADPLLRVALLRLAEDRHIALVNMHHVVSDGWSTDVLTREIVVLYESFLSGRPSPLPELAVQYGDYAHWQRGWLRGETLERQLDYWRRRLAEPPPELELPADRPRTDAPDRRGGQHDFVLPQELAAALEEVCRREGVTLFMVFLAGLEAFLYRKTHQEDFLIGALTAQRNRPEIEDLIGFFVNVLPIRGDLSGRPTFRELLQRAREQAIGAMSHQDAPFDELVRETRSDRDDSPLVRVVLNFAGVRRSAPPEAAPGRTAPGRGLRAEVLRPEETVSRFDLSLMVMQDATGVHGHWSYLKALFDADTVERWHGHFVRLLESAAADPDQPVESVEMLSAEEIRASEEAESKRRTDARQRLKATRAKAVPAGLTSR